MEQLKFLEVMFGDQPPLKPAKLIYQLGHQGYCPCLPLLCREIPSRADPVCRMAYTPLNLRYTDFNSSVGASAETKNSDFWSMKSLSSNPCVGSRENFSDREQCRRKLNRCNQFFSPRHFEGTFSRPGFIERSGTTGFTQGNIALFRATNGTNRSPIRFPSAHNPPEIIMDEDRIAGTARNFGGKVEEGVGRVTGDAQTQVQGLADQAAGTFQDMYGQAADAARDSAVTLDKWLRNTIETQPYTSAAVILGIGWLIGRMHRPL